MTIIILGAGISGLSAAYHLKQRGIKSIILEKENEYGGLCRSIVINNALFDYGVHVSFTNDDYVKTIFQKSVDGKFIEHEAAPCNYWHGFWIPHQPQDHLSFLPEEIRKEILIDFIKAYCRKNTKINNYHDWCHHQFGDYFAENFTDVYTKKFWTVNSEKLTIDWIGNRLHRPDLDTILDSAFGIQRENSHYVTSFRYPKQGGYNSFLRLLAQDLTIRYNVYPELIDPAKKEIRLNTGDRIQYDRLISTIPLPELINCIRDVPERITRAKNNLRWTSLLMLNFSINKKSGSSHSQWNYYYDEDIPYSRIFYMSRFSDLNSPPDSDTIQVEIPYSKDKPLPKGIEALTEEVIHCLSQTEKIEGEKIHLMGNFNIEYGYVIYDKARTKSVKIIREFLDENNIVYCGRFGEWAYLWSDQAFLSGKIAAETLDIMKELQ